MKFIMDTENKAIICVLCRRQAGRKKGLMVSFQSKIFMIIRAPMVLNFPYFIVILLRTFLSLVLVDSISIPLEIS